MTTTAQYRELARSAEEKLNWRMAIVYWRRALDAYPATSGKPVSADKDRMITALNADKQTLKSICPVCGGEMHTISCCDDISRPYCKACNKTYTPTGYDCEDDYAKKWHAITWDGGSEPSEVIEVR
jgi:transposase-like protein